MSKLWQVGDDYYEAGRGYSPSEFTAPELLEHIRKLEEALWVIFREGETHSARIACKVLAWPVDITD